MTRLFSLCNKVTRIHIDDELLNSLRPFVPSVCFAIEMSQDAISRGFSWAALEALEKVLQVHDGPGNRRS